MEVDPRAITNDLRKKAAFREAVFTGQRTYRPICTRSPAVSTGWVPEGSKAKGSLSAGTPQVVLPWRTCRRPFGGRFSPTSSFDHWKWQRTAEAVGQSRYIRDMVQGNAGGPL